MMIPQFEDRRTEQGKDIGVGRLNSPGVEMVDAFCRKVDGSFWKFPKRAIMLFGLLTSWARVSWNGTLCDKGSDTSCRQGTVDGGTGFQPSSSSPSSANVTEGLPWFYYLLKGR